MKTRIEIPIEVRYAETDQMGVVHHSHYLAWLELARTRLCEEAGHHYAAIEDLGYWLVVTGANIRYRQGARYGQTVTVTCELAWLGTRALEFGYNVAFEGAKLASATTEHVWVDRRSGRHCRIPEILHEAFLSLADQDSLIPRPR